MIKTTKAHDDPSAPTTLGEVIAAAGGGSSEQAFYGTVGMGDYGLYLVSSGHLTWAENPVESYSTPGCGVEFDRWVDIEIVVKEKD